MLPLDVVAVEYFVCATLKKPPILLSHHVLRRATSVTPPSADQPNCGIGYLEDSRDLSIIRAALSLTEFDSESSKRGQAGFERELGQIHPKTFIFFAYFSSCSNSG